MRGGGYIAVSYDYLSLHAPKEGHRIIALVIPMIGIVGGSNSWLDINTRKCFLQGCTEAGGDISPN